MENHEQPEQQQEENQHQEENGQQEQQQDYEDQSQQQYQQAQQGQFPFVTPFPAHPPAMWPAMTEMLYKNPQLSQQQVIDLLHQNHHPRVLVQWSPAHIGMSYLATMTTLPPPVGVGFGGQDGLVDGYDPLTSTDVEIAALESVEEAMVWIRALNQRVGHVQQQEARYYNQQYLRPLSEAESAILAKLRRRHDEILEAKVDAAAYYGRTL